MASDLCKRACRLVMRHLHSGQPWPPISVSMRRHAPRGTKAASRCLLSCHQLPQNHLRSSFIGIPYLQDTQQAMCGIYEPSYTSM